MLRRTQVALVAAISTTLLWGTAPAMATPEEPALVEVTTGRFTTLPGGADLGYQISGSAFMVRVPGHTFVQVILRGLDASTTYPAHVHNAPCSSSPPGGGHYQNVVGGPVDSVNEIWPTVETNPTGWGHGHARHASRARSDAQSVVIHYPPNTAIRLACVDLT